MLMDFYNKNLDNFLVPCSKITKDLWEEMLAECMTNPADSIGNGYVLLYCPMERGYEENSWCVTSYV